MTLEEFENEIINILNEDKEPDFKTNCIITVETHFLPSFKKLNFYVCDWKTDKNTNNCFNFEVKAKTYDELFAKSLNILNAYRSN